jgi:hypothetical protein
MTDTSERQDAGEALKLVLKRHAQPPAEVITQVKKGFDLLDAVGHAEVTRILIEEDPFWSWEPQGWAPGGGPLILTETCTLPQSKASREKGEAPKTVDMDIMWGWFTLHGKTIPCVGTCESGKPEGHKELISDLLVRGQL